jgi:hypothetical protein
MARKRPHVVDTSETPQPFYLVSKIPNYPENDSFIEEFIDDPGQLDATIEIGLGKLLVWFSVIGVHISWLYYPPGQPGTSVAFGVMPNQKLDFFVGDHENYDKKGVCTTVVKLKFTRPSELLVAGFRALPGPVGPWLALTTMDKGTYSSAALNPDWVKNVRCKKKLLKELIKKIGVDWDCNPHPKVTAALHPPANIPPNFFYWPAIPSSTNDDSCSEPASKRPRIGLSAGSSVEPMVYEWPCHATGGCSHYADSSHWNLYLES